MFSLFRLRTHARSFPFAFFIDTQSRKQRSRKVARVRFSVFSRLLRMLGRDVRHSFVFYYGGKTKKQVRKKKVDRWGESEGEKRAPYRRECAGGHKSRERQRERERTREEKKVTSTYKLVVGRETTKSKKKFKIKNYKQFIAPPHIDLSLSLSLTHLHT